MKVAIFGPNLSGGAQRMGNFHVHESSCGDCKHYGYNRKFGGDNAPGKSDMVITATSKWDVADFVYGPDAGDFDGPVEGYMDDFHFAPCVALPDMTDANRAVEVARAAPAVEATPPAVEAPVEAAPAPRLTLIKHPLDAALAALAEVEASVSTVNAGHERHFPVYVAGLRAYIEALRADLDDDNIAAKRLAE
jgi:hypothetical protein